MIDKSFDGIQLEKEQKELLFKIVEASRNLPSDKRSDFFITRSSAGDQLNHSGLPEGNIEIYYNDLAILERYGLIIVTIHNEYGIVRFDIDPLGYNYYKCLKGQSFQKIDRIETEIKNYINASEFQNKHPKPYEKWSEAESLLWESDSNQQLTTIGHLCRESMIEYIDNIVKQINPPDADSNKSSTKNRLKSILKYKAHKLGKTENFFLEAIYNFWESVSNLIQRQEHGAKKEGEELVWEDGRRVVFQTMVIIYEIDKALKRF